MPTTMSITRPDNAHVDVESEKQKQQEKQEQQQPVPENANNEAGKGFGIATFLLLVITLFFVWLPIIPFICIIISLILASVVTCSCCCASNYNLKPNVKRFAIATLVSLSLMLIVQIIFSIVAAANFEYSAAGTVSFSDEGAAGLSELYNNFFQYPLPQNRHPRTHCILFCSHSFRNQNLIKHHGHHFLRPLYLGPWMLGSDTYSYSK